MKYKIVGKINKLKLSQNSFVIYICLCVYVEKNKCVKQMIDRDVFFLLSSLCLALPRFLLNLICTCMFIQKKSMAH